LKGLKGAKIDQYSRALGEVVPLSNCVGFIDCTKIQISRPGGPPANQRALFSGHKPYHYSYQTITTPHGLVIHMYGQEEGRRQDTALYGKIDINLHLTESPTINRDPPTQFYIYRDGDYVMKPCLQVGFSRQNATPEQLLYNAEMSTAHVAWNGATRM
jgi:DDE superfamily endonuclease